MPLERQWTLLREGRSAKRQAILWLRCPFCGREVMAYKLSMSACGKRCECGAMHFRSGLSQYHKPSKMRKIT